MPITPPEPALSAPDTLAELEERLSKPNRGVVATLAGLPGDVMVLGVAGKMGPSLVRMLKQASAEAAVPRRILGVARFTDRRVQSDLEAGGIETIACDLLDERAVEQLPDAPNIFFLAGKKFGSSGGESYTWAMNTYLPSVICRKFRGSRIVALSTGNVYGLVPVAGGGSRETDSPNPVGEYAMSCLGRERMFEYFSEKLRIPTVLIRLNYACDLRYGVMVDLAQKVWAGVPVDLAMGHFNTIWQGDANAMIIQALGEASTPAGVLNLTGPEILCVREVCEELGRLLGRKPVFTGVEAERALLSDGGRALGRFGPLEIGSGQMLGWVAEWVRRGGVTLGKATHFESRDGKF